MTCSCWYLVMWFSYKHASTHARGTKGQVFHYHPNPGEKVEHEERKLSRKKGLQISNRMAQLGCPQNGQMARWFHVVTQVNAAAAASPIAASAASPIAKQCQGATLSRVRWVLCHLWRHVWLNMPKVLPSKHTRLSAIREKQTYDKKSQLLPLKQI